MTDEAIFEQEDISDLPDSWVWTTLVEISEITAEKRDPQEYPDLPFIGLEHVEAHTMKLLGTVPASELSSNANVFYAGDVLYCRLRPYLNKVYRPEFDGLCSSEFFVFREHPDLDNKYLQYFLNKWDFVAFATRQNEGDRPRVKGYQIEDYPFPLAPLNEQWRIVEEIEAQFTRLDAGIVALKRLEANLKRYKASVLKAACEGDLVPQDPDDEPASELLARILRERREQWEADKLAEYEAKGKKPPKNWQDKYKEPVEPDTDDLPYLPEGWEVLSMDALTTRITSGSRDWKQYYDRGTGTFLMAQNIRMGKLDLSYRQAVDPPPDDSSCERSQVKIGDLLVTIVGANTGDVAPVDEDLPEHYVCQSVALMRPVDNSLSEWLTIYLTSPENGQKQYDRYIYGAGCPHLSFDQLKMTAIPLPSPDEQRRIVETFKLSTSIIDEIERAIEINIQRAERLRQSILKEAFAGRLVPQDPSDEPASELLARIRAEREKKS